MPGFEIHRTISTAISYINWVIANGNKLRPTVQKMISAAEGVLSRQGDAVVWQSEVGKQLSFGLESMGDQVNRVEGAVAGLESTQNLKRNSYGWCMSLCLAICSISIALSSATHGQESPAKLPIPNDAALQAASKLIRDLFKADYDRADSSKLKNELANKLLNLAVATKDDPAGKFALLTAAKNIAIQAKKPITVLRSIDEQAKGFQVPDSLNLRAEALFEIAKGSDKKTEAELLPLVMDVLRETVAADRYDEAVSLSNLAMTLAKATGSKELRRHTKAVNNEVTMIANEYKELKKSLAVLEVDPTDTSANLAVGSFKCFFKDDWESGIPFLALGGDHELPKAAQLELEDVPPAKTLADFWWTLANGMDGDGIAKRNIRIHAAKWYRVSLAGLTGLGKAVAEKRIAESELLARSVLRGREDKEGQVDLEHTPGPPGVPVISQLLISSRWSDAINVGSPINSKWGEYGSTISSDGRMLVFRSDRPGGLGGKGDLWVATRNSNNAPWSRPINLGPNINTDATESGPSITGDGLTLFFSSNRPGGEGGSDIYVCHRTHLRKSWGKPENLGLNINSAHSDGQPAISRDGLTLAFSSDRPGGKGATDIWMSTRPSADAPWGQPSNIEAANSSDIETMSFISPDGLAIVFSSFQPEGRTILSLKMVMRKSVDAPFRDRVELPKPFNLGSGRATLTDDGTTMFFSTVRKNGGGFDIWMSKRIEN